MFAIKNRKGMTLIEIMIVLAIIGGLMTLLLPKLTGQQEKAKMKEAKIQLAQIVSALQMYYTDCGKFPAALSNLIEADANCTNWGPEAYAKKSTLVDPWKNEFSYEVTNTEYNLKSFGKDKKEGGAGTDADITLDEAQ